MFGRKQVRIRNLESEVRTWRDINLAKDQKIAKLERELGDHKKRDQDINALLNNVARELSGVYELTPYSFLTNWAASTRHIRVDAAEREKIAKIAREEYYSSRNNNYAQQATPAPETPLKVRKKK